MTTDWPWLQWTLRTVKSCRSWIFLIPTTHRTVRIMVPNPIRILAMSKSLSLGLSLGVYT